MSSIAAGTTSSTALVSTGDTTGNLVFQTNGSTTALTIDTAQNVTVAGDLTVNGTIVGVSGVLAGTVIWFAANTAPTGYLKANGANVSRTTYASLFAAIGTVFGVGDGSTTFGLPDLRGEFIRGWDDGRGVDSGRAFGSAQLDQMQKITGATQFNRMLVATSEGIVNAGALSIADASQGTQSGDSGGSSGTFTKSIVFDSSTSPGARTSSTTSGETRVRNVALLACIKF